MEYSPIGIVDYFESLQWLTYYQEVGEVLLVCPYTKENKKILKVGNLLRHEDEQGMLIVQAELEDKDGKATLLIRGQTYATVLEQRIGKNTTLLTTLPQLVEFLEMNHRENGLCKSVVIENNVQSKQYYLQSSWENLLQVLENVCVQTGVGFTSKLIEREHTVVNKLFLYQGRDLSLAEKYVGYLGGTDEISNLKIVDGNKEFKNTVYVLGKEKNGVTPWVVCYLQPPKSSSQGLQEHEKREFVLKATDVSYNYITSVKTNAMDYLGNPIYAEIEKEYTEWEYLEILRARGINELVKTIPKLEISAEIMEENSILKYGIDYFLGDIVLLNIAEYGVKAKARVGGTKLVDEVGVGRYRTIVLMDFEVVE